MCFNGFISFHIWSWSLEDVSNPNNNSWLALGTEKVEKRFVWPDVNSEVHFINNLNREAIKSENSSPLWGNTSVDIQRRVEVWAQCRTTVYKRQAVRGLDTLPNTSECPIPLHQREVENFAGGGGGEVWCGRIFTRGNRIGIAKLCYTQPFST